jgi:hypothetical protein
MKKVPIAAIEKIHNNLNGETDRQTTKRGSMFQLLVPTKKNNSQNWAESHGP